MRRRQQACNDGNNNTIHTATITENQNHSGPSRVAVVKRPNVDFQDANILSTTNPRWRKAGITQEILDPQS